MLVNIFIYRRFSKLVTTILTPFLEARTPEEAKKMLKKAEGVSPQVQKFLFRKVS
jgi:hypothetical protein